MDSPPAAAAEEVQKQYVRCVKCKKIFECSRYDTNALLAHIRSDHPEIEIDETSTANISGNISQSTVPRCQGSGTPLPSNNKKPKENGINTRLPINRLAVQHTPPYEDNIIRPSKSNSKTNTHSNNNKNKVTMFDAADPHNQSADEVSVHGAPHSNSSHERLIMRTENAFKDSPKASEINCDLLPPALNNGTPPPTSTTYARHFNATNTPTPPGAASQNRRLRPQAQPRLRSRYRTAIEKWRPGTGTLYCPKCGATRRPLIRTEAERSANNSCCAVCILGCWPLCFLPFLWPNVNDKEYLHCSNCKAFLGLYERERNCVRPNRQYCQPEDLSETERVNDGDMRMRAGDEPQAEKRNCRCA